jgi:hypothetical protein
MLTCCRSISRRAAEGHEAGHGALCRLRLPKRGREPAGRGGMMGDPTPPPRPAPRPGRSACTLVSSRPGPFSPHVLAQALRGLVLVRRVKACRCPTGLCVRGAPIGRDQVL